MKQLGDITKIRGYDIEPVDIITGGSPCQDLSVAGKRAGLAGERSGLFMEQMRIVKEMREHDRSSGRTAWHIRPRYMVWENVPGAFSSGKPKGADFAAVIEEIIKVAEPGAFVCVRVPERGWTKSGCYYADDGSWSIAWRVHDAQFWGVPQRRKRISLVADFGGLSAPEILFERKGLRRDTESGETQGERIAAGAEKGAGGAISFQERAGKPGGGKGILIQEEHVGALSTLNNQSVLQCVGVDVYNQEITGASDGGNGGAMNPWDPQSARVYPGDGVWHSLNANENGGQSRDAVFCLQGNGIDRADTAGCNGAGWRKDVSYTLNTIDRPAIAFAQNQRDEVRNLGDKAGALAAEPGMKQQTYVMAYALDQQGGKGGANFAENVCPPILSDSHGTPHAVCYDARGNGDGEIAPTMTGDHQSRVTDYTALCVRNVYGSDVIPSLVASAYKGPGNTQDGYCVVTAQGPEHDKMLVVFDKEMYNAGEKMTGEMQARYDEVAPTVRADSHPSGGCTSVVRRLTPLECERLQGFPDDWSRWGIDEKGEEYELSDSARYRLQGNSIARPFWIWLLRRIAAQYERPATMGSLFDGQGGFPLCGAESGIRTLWASEIEKHAVAVTRYRFGEE